MDLSKHERQVVVYCPGCGGQLFSASSEGSETLTCAQCGRQLSRDELLQENSENIEANVREMAEDAVPDVADEMRKMLKKAFKGNKNVRCK